MENRRFDALTRWIAAGAASRRGTLRLLIGGALGAAGVQLAAHEAAAGRCLFTKECPGRRRCCKKKCTKTDNNDKNCGRCGKQCKGPEKCCGDRCENLKRDKKNCGKCGRRCKKGETCRNGRCKEDTCIEAGKFCTINGDDPCCEDSFCKDLGGSGLCCLPEDAACVGDFECCSDECDGGFCDD